MVPVIELEVARHRLVGARKVYLALLQGRSTAGDNKEKQPQLPGSLDGLKWSAARWATYIPPKEMRGSRLSAGQN